MHHVKSKLMGSPPHQDPPTNDPAFQWLSVLLSESCQYVIIIKQLVSDGQSLYILW